jgi:cell division protein FtsB
MTVDPTSVADRAAAETRKKQRCRSRQVRLAVVFLGCVLLLDALFGERGFFQTMRSREDLVRARHQLADLERENEALRGEIRRLEHDPATLELVAREQLALVRRGEILVVLTGVK